MCRSVLASELSVPIDSTLVFRYPSVRAVTEFIAADILHLANGKPAQTEPADWLAAIESMDDEEVSRQLTERLVELS